MACLWIGCRQRLQYSHCARPFNACAQLRRLVAGQPDRLHATLPPSWVAWQQMPASTADTLAAHDCLAVAVVQLEGGSDDVVAAHADRGTLLPRSPRVPGQHAQAALAHELSKVRFAAFRRSLGALGTHPAAPGAETLSMAPARHRSQTGKGAMSWATARPSSRASTFGPIACRMALQRALGVERPVADSRVHAQRMPHCWRGGHAPRSPLRRHGPPHTRAQCRA
jgi:hypothetical protein